MSYDDFEPTNPLEEALRTAALDDTRSDAFFAALARETLLVPVPNPPDENRQVELPVMQIEGRDHIAAFTSETQLAAAGGRELHRLELPGELLARMWPQGVAMAINPHGELGLSLPPDAVASLAGEVRPQSIAPGTEIQWGAPDEEPAALLEVLAKAAASIPAIAALYRAVVRFSPGDGQERLQLVIGVRFGNGGRPDMIIRHLAEVAGPGVGFIALDEATEDPLERWMIDDQGPFYPRPAAD